MSLSIPASFAHSNRHLAASSPPPSSALPSELDDDLLPSNFYDHQPSKKFPPDNSNTQDDEELATTNRLPAVTLQLWGSLLKVRGYEITDGAVLPSPTKVRAAAAAAKLAGADVSPVRVPERKPKAGKGFDARESVISSFRRANSFAPVQERTELGSGVRQPFRRTTSIGLSQKEVGGLARVGGSFLQSAPLQYKGEGSGATAGPSKLGESYVTNQLFTGMKFRVLGEAKSPNVRTAIEENGGVVVRDEEADEDADYIVVRLVR